MMIFIINIEIENSVTTGRFRNDFTIEKIAYYKNKKINNHVLKTCMVD